MTEPFGWFDWPELYDAAVRRAADGARFVECGTFFGKSALHLARAIRDSGKQITFDTWDDWSSVPPGFGYVGWVGGDPPREDQVRATLAGLPVRVRTGDSLDAAKQYADGSLDMVFLDDDHSAEHLAAECHVWWPKLKPGGLMAGHDYDWPSVREGLELWAEFDDGLAVVPTSVKCWMVVKP